MTDDDLTRLLTATRRIALVGASNKPARPSYEVMQFLLSQGYDVTPVNPGLAGQTILGRTVVASLDDAARSTWWIYSATAPQSRHRSRMRSAWVPKPSGCSLA